MKQSNYDKVTELILEKLEEGIIPWQRPWGGPDSMPKNLTSGKNYRGVNLFLLSMMPYDAPYFLTYKQAAERGGTVKRGQKGMPIFFFSMVENKKSKGDFFPMLKRYTVFNVEQCEGIEYPKQETEEKTFIPIERAENIVTLYPNRPNIYHEGKQAYYSKSVDKVVMPPKELFIGPEEYYSTLFHELGHSTGHKDRLNRKSLEEVAAFGSHSYSKEELVAEFSAAFLCAHSGIDNTVENSAAYIQSWHKRLKDNPKWLMWAASQAQKASDLILNTKPGA